MSIYEQMKEAGIEIGNHESDLYVKVTPVSRKIVLSYRYRSIVSLFKSNLDGQMWFDIPFAYDPFWQS